MPKIVPVLIKLAVSLGLMALLLWQVDYARFAEAFARVSLWRVVPLVLLFAATTIIGGWRWAVVLRCQGLKLSPVEGARLYLIGYFFNNFLPTAVGGDVVRGIAYARSAELPGTGKAARIAGSILVERVLGIVATMCIALVFLPLAPMPAHLTGIVIGLNALLLGGLAAFVLARTRLSDLILALAPAKIKAKVQEVVDTIRDYKECRSGILAALGVSALYQGALISVVWTASVAAGIDAPPMAHFFVFVPLVWVLSLMPFALGALGVREAGFVYFFSVLGAPEAEGLVLSLLVLAMMLGTGLLGGAVWGISLFRSRNS